MPENSDQTDESSDYSGWVDEDVQLVKCLFCSGEFTPGQEYSEHLNDKHDFDLRSIVKDMKLDIHSVICLINYIRSLTKDGNLQDVDLQRLKQDLHNSKEFRKDILSNEIYLRPVFQDDPIFSMIDDFMGDSLEAEDGCMDSNGDGVRRNGKEMTIEDLKSELSRAQAELQSCRKLVKTLTDGPRDIVEVDAFGPKDDRSYFELYESLSIHHTMLIDEVRTGAYKEFIEKASSIFRGKTVLDVGSGTSILSLFCAKAGAKRVYSVDNAEPLKDITQQIVRDNGYEDVIVIIKDLVENVKLEEKVDIIVSEWMGYFLLFEKMLDSVIEARDRFLAPDGYVFPSHARMYIAAIRDNAWHTSKFKFWEDVYGFNMRAIKSKIFKEVFVETVNPSVLVSEPYIIHELDTAKVQLQDLDLSSSINIVPTSPGPITGFCGWFDVSFNAPGVKPVTLSTSPNAAPTHWHQTIMGLDKVLHVDKGDYLFCEINTRGRRSSTRNLIMKLNVRVLNDSGECKEEIFMDYVLK